MVKKSHKKSVLEWFETHETITPLEAWQNFGCYRLAAVIARMREEGYIIETLIYDGEKHAHYKLLREGVEYDG
jgi:hypothetical protein